MIRTAGVLLLLSVSAAAIADPADSEASGEESRARTASFSVMPRLDKLVFFPCADCHEYMDPNPAIRELDADPGHPAKLIHGEGAVWCSSCHGAWPYNELQTLLGEPVAYDDSHRVCGGCHSNRLRDWKHGAHGKRVDVWRGDRLLYGCPECHNPHEPAIRPRAPMDPPSMRAGLEHINGHAEKQIPIWESRSGKNDD